MFGEYRWEEDYSSGRPVYVKRKRGGEERFMRIQPGKTDWGIWTRRIDGEVLAWAGRGTDEPWINKTAWSVRLNRTNWVYSDNQGNWIQDETFKVE